MKSKILAGVGIAAVAAIALTGCSSSDSADSAGPTTVTVWHGFTEADGDVVKTIADEFNASQSDYKVEIEVNPWNVISDKLLPALKAGNGPDLVTQEVVAATGYIRQGAFVSLQDFYDNPDNQTDTYDQHVVDYTQVDGEYYGVPMGYAPYSIWYNKQMWADAGVTECPTTWDDMLALAEKLTVKGSGGGTPDVYGLSISDKQIAMLPAFLEAGGGDVYDADKGVVLDTPENVKTLEWLRSAYAKGAMPTNIGLADAVALFTGKKAAMTWIGPWIVSGAEAAGVELGVCNAPAGSERVATPAAANYWWLTSQGADDEKTKAGSEAFLAYFNSHDSQVTWAVDANYPPNRNDVTAEEMAGNPVIATLTPFVKDAYIRLPGLPGGATDVEAELDTLSVNISQNTGGDVSSLVKDTSDKLEGIISEFE
ncbi:extracellular solute-binding protein [Microbacterium sp. W1N]|uniref:extracellular solute-binding protein n=1 Tax=Microbacterium festucae TaxID=2977531 RepID=UPI0021BE48C8|nr:extracellular solute-binding protein [Microbacterium festucae]MCT9819754.1 extracellular solute-binding protein [Microbacterium festucae]